MAKHQTVLSVFVASPSDLEEERDLLEQIIRKFNADWSRHLGISLELIRWETHAYPSFGEDAQSVINDQIPDDYDIFIGLMWYKFGTPTKRAGSGTEEEFNRALERFKNDPRSIQLMFYFKDTPAPLPPTQLNFEQLSQVASFRKKIGQEGGLHWAFESREQFEILIHSHLTKQIQAWISNNSTAPDSTAIAPPPQRADTFIDADEDEPGLIDLMDQFEDEFSSLSEVVTRIAEETVSIGNKMKERAQETVDFSRGPNSDSRKAAKRLVSKAALDMDHFVSRMETELPLFSQHLRSGMKCLTLASPIILEIGTTTNDLKQAKSNLEALRDMRDTLGTVEVQIQGFQDSVKSLPRMTSDLNKSKRAMIAVLQKLIDEFQAYQSMSIEIESTYDAILSK